MGVGSRPIGKSSVDRKRTGRGTKILIRLPVAKQPPESSSVEPIAAKPMGGKNRAENQSSRSVARQLVEVNRRRKAQA